MSKAEDSRTVSSKENKQVDVIKFFAALLIVASHCLPLVRNNNVNFLYGQWLFRFCVPFFLISAGYFFSSFQELRKLKYIKRIAIIYFLSSVLYIPFFISNSMTAIIRTAIFGYYHLWYLSALLVALIIRFFFEKHFSRIFNKLYFSLTVLLIIIGAFYDEYQHVFIWMNDIPLVNYIGYLIQVSGGHRHALFFAFPMVLIGKFLYEHQRNIQMSKTICILLTILSLFVSLAETLLLRRFGGESITCDITLFNYLPAVFLFILTFSYQQKALETINTRALRKVADIVYISHKLFILVVDKFLSIAYIPRLILILILSISISSLYVKVESVIKDKFKLVVNYH